MNLEELLSAPQPPRMFCQFGKWFASLDEASQITIRKHFAETQTTTSHIARVLIEHANCPVSESSIRSHRRGECRSCGTMK
jgi:hypothetical protein